MDNQTLRETSERIDELLDELGQSAVPAVMERVEELMRSVMTLYGAGLDRVMELADHSADEGLVRRLADDDVVGNLLILHDLHPDDVLTRVQAALDQVRPYLGSHAGGVELLGVDAESVAHLQLQGSCDGCASSALTVQERHRGRHHGGRAGRASRSRPRAWSSPAPRCCRSSPSELVTSARPRRTRGAGSTSSSTCRRARWPR